MILVAVLTFVATTGGWGFLLWLALRRLADEPSAFYALVELARRKPAGAADPAEPAPERGCPVEENS